MKGWSGDGIFFALFPASESSRSPAHQRDRLRASRASRVPPFDERVSPLAATINRDGIAGAGISAKPWQENTAVTLMSVGSLGSVVAIAALLVQWRWTA